MSIINNPHDKLFKETLSDIEVVRDFLKNYFPNKIIEKIDLTRIQIVKDSFIEEDLQETFSDILYKTAIQEKDAYIYILFEHKSYPYKLITIQFLKYIISIWELLIKQKDIKSDNLPIILPILIYHGEKEWDIGLNLADILDTIPEDWKMYIPDFRYILYDLSAYSDEEIKGGIKLKIYFEIAIHLLKEDFNDRFVKLVTLLDKLLEQKTGIEYIKTVIRYILSVKEGITLQNLISKAREVSIERSEEIMTIAEELRKEGRKEGHEEGIKEGMIMGIETALELKYGKTALGLMEEIKKIKEINKLEEIMSFVREKDNFNEFKEIIYKH
jgi:predicted transposase/invertase (TIGR01784 family)